VLRRGQSDILLISTGNRPFRCFPPRGTKADRKVKRNRKETEDHAPTENHLNPKTKFGSHIFESKNNQAAKYKKGSESGAYPQMRGHLQGGPLRVGGGKYCIYKRKSTDNLGAKGRTCKESNHALAEKVNRWNLKRGHGSALRSSAWEHGSKSREGNEGNGSRENKGRKARRRRSGNSSIDAEINNPVLLADDTSGDEDRNQKRTSLSAGATVSE
jgi:hypothetical protein